MRARHMPGSWELVGIALWLTSSLFVLPTPAGLDWEIGSLPPRILAWLRRFGREAALAEFPGTKLPLMLTRELVSQSTWADFENARLLPVHPVPRIARPLDSSVRQRAIAAAWQLRFVWMRVCYHSIEGARYAIEKRRWDRSLSRAAAQQTSLIS